MILLMSQKKLNNKFFFILTMLFFLFVGWSTARANAIVPALQFFSPFLCIPSLILLIVITIVEAALLKLFIRPIKFCRHLFYSTIINIVSSIAGSFLGFINYSFAFSDFYWNSLVITLLLPFIVTYITEYPVILWLYGKYISIKKAALITFTINIVSYIVFLVLLTPVFLIGIMKMSEYLDNKRLMEWSHSEIMQQESGTIYSLIKQQKDGEIYDFNGLGHKKNYELRSYDLAQKKWQLVRKLEIGGYGDFFPAKAWSVSQSLFAYPNDSNSVLVLKKADFAELCRISIACDQIAISQSEQLIAILKPIYEINVQKKGESWFQTLGNQCELEIYEIPSGNQVNKLNKCILPEGLDWSSDSKKILLVVLRDDDVQRLKYRHEKQDYGRVSEVLYFKDFCPKMICLYDTIENSITELCEGTSPIWRKNENEFIFTKDGKIYIYDIKSRQIKFLCKDDYTKDFTLSASGQNVIGIVGTQNPMWSNKYFLTVINIQNPDLKYVIDIGKDYCNVDWQEK